MGLKKLDYARIIELFMQAQSPAMLIVSCRLSAPCGFRIIGLFVQAQSPIMLIVS